MKKIGLLYIVKSLLALSSFGLFISFFVENNHVCTGEECEICYILSIVSLSSFCVLLLSSLSLVIYVKRFLTKYYLSHQKQDLETSVAYYESINSCINISLITLKKKLQIAM